MNPVLSALADRYRRSSAGRGGGGGVDFLTDFRELLKSARCEDGDALVRARDDLRRAEVASGGLIALDHHPKDPHIIYRVRLRPGGERWLFQQIGQMPPAATREALAGFFRDQSIQATPHPGWRPWLETLSSNALEGKSVLPFERDGMALNAEFLRITSAVLAWREESLIRYASAVICGDSKRLEVLQPKLHQALRVITGDPAATLESFQILQAPRSVLIHGPLLLDFPEGTVDFGLLTGPVSLSGHDLDSATGVRSPAPACLTVENEGVFRELAKRNPGFLLVHTSFPGAATRSLLNRLPAAITGVHFGDTDPAGFDILRDLREKIQRPIQSVGMGYRPRAQGIRLTDAERKTVERLLQSGVMEDVRPALRAMLEAGDKGDYEQESLGPEGLTAILAEVGGSGAKQAAHRRAEGSGDNFETGENRVGFSRIPS